MTGKNVFLIITIFFLSVGCGSNQTTKKPVTEEAPTQIQDNLQLPHVTLHQVSLDGQKSEVIRLLAAGVAG
jgi:hypothetical protein